MKWFLLTVALSVSTASYEQITVSNLSLTDTTLEYIYAGVDNELSITGKGFHPATTLISVIGGGSDLTLVSPGHIIVRANIVTDSLRLQLTGKTGKVIWKKYFKVRYCNWDLTFAGRKDTVYRKEEILTNPVLTFQQRDCYYKTGVRIVSFDLSALDNSDNIVSYHSETGKLSPENLALIVNAPAGSLIVFDNIRCMYPGGELHRSPSFYFIVR